MSYHYFLNWMGPISASWYDANGSDWAAGRIDISADEDNPYGYEVSVPIISGKDWDSLREWLSELVTEEPILELDKILELYYAGGYPEVVFFRDRVLKDV